MKPLSHHSDHTVEELMARLEKGPDPETRVPDLVEDSLPTLF